MKNAFDRLHRLYDPFMRLTGFYADETIIRLLRPEPHERFIDVGGGTGWIARHIAQHGPSVTVLDISLGMLSHVDGPSGVRAVCGDGRRMGIRSGVFDGAVLSDALHHIPETEWLLGEVARVLRPGGRLLMHDFERTSRWVRLLQTLESRLVEKVRYSSMDELGPWLRAAGFDHGETVRTRLAFFTVWRKDGRRATTEEN
ncbi:MAG: class I SAM-dependent methyltransferase [Acidobacteria bacterium]|nr:class I SAM-dependent methyltransferase [Acidobacteriota bacterium]